jgi:serine/threonine-protein kinase
MPAPPARVLGRYALFDEIASGGMGTVCYGRLRGPAGFARTVAIKRLHPTFARDPEFVARFLDEARLAARIRHPNVLPTLDVEALSRAEGNETFIVMELVLGESAAGLLREAIERHALPKVPIAVRILIDALEGLHAAHETCGDDGAPLGLVHRDVSPQNVMVGVDGVARVLDFGIAKAALASDSHTGLGVLKGKLGYLAPEQIREGSRIDRRVDVYAASVMLWELLTGERPFGGTTREERLDAILHAHVPAPSERRPEVSFGLDAIVLRGMSRNREERFATAHEMAVALEEAVEPATARAVGAWVEATAATELAQRREAIARIERTDDRSEPFLLGTPTAPTGTAAPERTDATMDATPFLLDDGTTATARPRPPLDSQEATAPHAPMARRSAAGAQAQEPSSRATTWVAVGLAAAILGIGAGIYFARQPSPPTTVSNASAAKPGPKEPAANGATGTSASTTASANAGTCARAPLEDVVELSTGPSGHHTCARTKAGAIWCWGDDRQAQLGQGATSERRVGAFEVPKLAGAKQVGAGDAHACALGSDGKVSCWGKGLLLRPTPVLGQADVSAIALGGHFACAVHGDGALECWGDDESGQLGGAQREAALAAKIEGLPKVERVATGGAHACAIAKDDRAVWCWGADDLGQLGDGNTDRAAHPKPAKVALSFRAASIAAGDKTTFAWSETGELWGWGFSVKRPVKVQIANVDRVAAGGRVTCALRRDRTVSCWGFSDRGVLGVTTDDTATPVGVADLPAARDIVAGASHACALADGGAVWCWGANDRGELGLPPDAERHPKPVRVEKSCL